MSEPAYDGATGTAGGAVFGTALARLAAAHDVDAAALGAVAGLSPALVAAVFAGNERLAPAALARIAHALRLRPIAFLQQTHVLGPEAYAGGLDPLYFLPEGPIRYDARIYMREINPRHGVPEGDMTRRSPALAALHDDPLLDALGRLELELTYLLRTAVQATGGVL